jgi:hypothetical protein
MICPTDDKPEGAQKVDPVLVAPEKGLSPVTSGSDMINRAGMFDSQGTNHVRTISGKKHKVKQ